MLQHSTFCCLLLLTMCHVVLYEKRYTSDNWHIKSKADRPYIIKGRKSLHKGSFTMKRGTQTLQYSPSPSQGGLGQALSFHSMNTFMQCFIQCTNCQCKSHKVAQCPLVQCNRCREFGHTTVNCKKTLMDK